MHPASHLIPSWVSRFNCILALVALPMLVGCPQSGTGWINPRISGRVLREDGAAVSGVVIAGNNGATTGVTDASGLFEVTVPYQWSGALTPILVDTVFDPAVREYQNVIQNMTGQDIVASPTGSRRPDSQSPDEPASNSIQVSNQTISMLEDETATITLAGHSDNGGDLTMNIITPPTHGTLGALNNSALTSATVTYTPAANYNGSDSFTFRANNGPTTSNVGTVTITVNSVNDEPVISPSGTLSLAVQQNSLGTDVANRVSISASDPDAATLIWTISTAAGHGLAQVASGSPSVSGGVVVVSYQPTTGYVGADSFGVQVGDGQGGTANSTVNVSVGGYPISGTVTRVIAGGGTQAVNGVGISFTGSGGSVGQNYTTTTNAQGQFSQLVPFGWSGSVAATDADNWAFTPANRQFATVSGNQAGQDFSAGRNYYVATTGSDSNSGTLALPLRTIQAGANAVKPGDTCIVRAGTYTESVTIAASGEIGHAVTFKSFAGESVIIDGGGTLYGGFVNDTKSYVAIDGFEIRNFNPYGIVFFNDAMYGVVRNCNIHNCTAQGVLMRGADYFLVEYNEFHHNGSGAETNYRDTTLNWAENGVFSHNVVHDNGTFTETSGPDGLAGPGSHNCIWEYNISYNNTDDGIDISSGGGGANDPENAIIRFNVCFHNGVNPATGLPGTGGGNGIKVSTNAGGGHTVHHNISFLNKRAAFDQDMSPGYNGNLFYNNVGWKNGVYATSSIRGGFLIEGGNFDPGRDTLRNNIGFGNDPPGLAGYNGRDDFWTHKMGIATTDYNAWGVAPHFADADPGHDQEGTHSLIGANPLFVNPDAPINRNYAGTGGIAGKWQFIWDQVQANFALQAGSPCIDAGTTIPGITDGYAGGAPDMGAIEHTP